MKSEQSFERVLAKLWLFGVRSFGFPSTTTITYHSPFTSPSQCFAELLVILLKLLATSASDCSGVSE